MAKITRQTIIADVLREYPETMKVMQKYGFHCFGCHMNVYETVEQGCYVHGMSSEQIDEMVNEMNEIAEGSPAKPKPVTMETNDEENENEENE